MEHMHIYKVISTSHLFMYTFRPYAFLLGHHTQHNYVLVENRCRELRKIMKIMNIATSVQSYFNHCCTDFVQVGIDVLQN